LASLCFDKSFSRQKANAKFLREDRD